MLVKELARFIRERHAINILRKLGKPKPWTKDPILQKYRFCNVYRELDTTTQWIAKNWRTPNANDPDLWFAMTVARFVNWPETLSQLGYPKSGVRYLDWFIQTIEKRQAEGKQVYGAAYTISTNGRKMVKHQYLVQEVFKPLWDNCGAVRDRMVGRNATLEGVHDKLTSFQGLGSFMSAQVIADFKYVQMRKAPDWWVFAASGPGSRRGLNRVYGRPKDNPWGEVEWGKCLATLQTQIDPLVEEFGMLRLHAQDLQNCLCEFDKYERVRLGEGTPRKLYPGQA